MTISPIQFAQSAVGLSNFSGYLSPDALMTYCQTRLQGIDAQVQQSFLQQQAANNQSEILATALGGPFSANAGGWDPTAQGSGSAMIGDLQTAIDQLPNGSDAKEKLVALRDQIANQIDSSGQLAKDLDGQGPSGDAVKDYWCHFDPTSGASQWTGSSDETIVNGVGGKPNTNKVDTTTVSAWTDQIKAVQSSINNDSELNMVNLQSLMSQRQEAIQLCTNLVQSLGDECNKVADNVGH